MRKMSFRKKPLLISVGLILVLAGIGVGIWKYANSPAQGTIIVKRTDNPNVQDKGAHYVSLSNKYYSLLYMDNLTTDLPDKEVPQSLTYDYLTDRDEDQSVLTSLEVYLKPLPKGGITLDADYKNYVSQTDLYKVSTRYFGGEIVNMAVRNKGEVERNAMWVHENYLLVVKMKDDNKNTIDTNIETILKSVQWQ